MDDNSVLPFARLGDDLPPDADELVAPGDIYACVTGQRQAIAIRLIWKDDRTVSIPYGFLPLIWGGQPDQFIIEFPHLFSVLVRGKELADLQRRIEDHRRDLVTRIRPAPGTGHGLCRHRH